MDSEDVTIKSLLPLHLKLHFRHWIPTVNNLTSVIHGRKVKSKRGREFMAQIAADIQQARGMVDIPLILTPVAVVIKVYPPTRRRYDIDNLAKAVLDSMTQSGIWLDDSQVAFLALKKCKPRKDGEFTITIKELPDYGDGPDE